MISQKDRIESAIRHIQTSVDIDPWAMELAVDALKAQIDKDTNAPNNDCISRQEVIRLILERGLYCDTQEDREVSADIIRQLPSAQPEQSIAEWQKDFREYINMLNIPRDDYNGIMEYINEVPSAQPEPCEDAVSRKLMYELGATCMARRDDNGELVALGRLDMLPSAQPERNTGEQMDDLISRAEALACFHSWMDKHGDIHEPDEMPEYRAIEALPERRSDED